MISLDPKDFPELDAEHLEELQDIARQMGKAIRRREERREARRLGLARKPRASLPAEESPAYPPDPEWRTDDRGRFWYQDYDGESLHVRHEEGDVWVDKKGQGPVFVRQEDIPVIIAALQGPSWR